jgi:TnpA family transposase
MIRGYRRLRLPTVWGDGKTAAAAGTKFSLYQENLLSEYHVRYGGYSGIAYHHVSDTYIALFSHFIACGVWEAVYIIDGMLKNQSEIQPEAVSSDTQGQTAPVFGLAYLLGIQLWPRIRNWKDLVFYRPTKDARYQHLMPLFKGVIDWELIERHWQDMLQVILSIKAGKVLPSTLLRKLTNYSRKNKLYQAFRELGRVIRTLFLLRFISDEKFRRHITATTNKVEAYNRFTKWLTFGGEEGVIPENDPDEQEKRIKYTDVVANAVIYQNVVDMTRVLTELSQEGFSMTREDLAALSPYLTHHIRRFGDYVVDLSQVPPPFEDTLVIPDNVLPK